MALTATTEQARLVQAVETGRAAGGTLRSQEQRACDVVTLSLHDTLVRTSVHGSPLRDEFCGSAPNGARQSNAWRERSAKGLSQATRQWRKNNTSDPLSHRDSGRPRPLRVPLPLYIVAQRVS